MTGVVTFGETLALVTTAEAGPLATAHTLTLGIGGSESNVAIGLARLGCPVAWFGRVGADPFGERVTREIRAEGVDVHAIVDAQARTGLMVKERRVAGTSRVFYYRAASAGSRLQSDDLDLDLIRAAQVLHISGITPALSASAAATVQHAVRTAHDAGVQVSLDVNYRSALWSREQAAAALCALLPLVEIVFAGADEVSLLTGLPGASPEEQAAAVVAAGPAEAVIKLGPVGAVANVRGTLTRVPAMAVTVVDTVGAGDAFVAGYLAETCAGADTATALATAARAGALACLTPGDWEGLPHRADLPLPGANDDPVAR